MPAYFTDLPIDEVRRLEALKDQEINEAKKILAFEATKICRGEEEARKAQETAIQTFEQGIAGGDLPCLEVDCADGLCVLDAFVQIGFCASKGEARRLIKQGGLKLNDKPVCDEITAAVPLMSLTGRLNCRKAKRSTA